MIGRTAGRTGVVGVIRNIDDVVSAAVATVYGTLIVVIAGNGKAAAQSLSGTRGRIGISGNVHLGVLGHNPAISFPSREIFVDFIECCGFVLLRHAGELFRGAGDIAGNVAQYVIQGGGISGHGDVTRAEADIAAAGARRRAVAGIPGIFAEHGQPDVHRQTRRTELVHCRFNRCRFRLPLIAAVVGPMLGCATPVRRVVEKNYDIRSGRSTADRGGKEIDILRPDLCR